MPGGKGNAHDLSHNLVRPFRALNGFGLTFPRPMAWAGMGPRRWRWWIRNHLF